MSVVAKPLKPLGRKAYGSIPHLPGSRLGPGDHSIHAGQDAICLVKARDRHDRVIVTEKLDGSNVAIARIGDDIVALTRSGYLASDSPYEQHHLFGAWLAERASLYREALKAGERLNGEWLAQAHGTRYDLPHDPFVAFDLMVGERRLSWDDVVHRCAASASVHARVLSDGPPTSVAAILPILDESPHGAIGPVEGAVWRVERRGVFDFNAKWVRRTKVDGQYLSAVSGRPDVWNWRPSGDEGDI